MSPRDVPELSWLLPRNGLLAHAWTDRDLAWLEFNKRVLHEAVDERTPLLERLKFLAIFSSNLDEWFMKRAQGLREAQTGSAVATANGAPGSNRLAPVREAIL